MKLRNKILFSIIYIIGIFILFFPNNGIAQSYNDDIEYTFQETIFIEADNFTYSDWSNTKNKTEYTQYYNATYDFNNETIGNSPLNWLNFDTDTCNTSVINNSNNHNKVLQFFDNSVSGRCRIEKDFTSTIDLIIEFWYQYNATEAYSEYFRLILLESNTNLIDISLNYITVGGIVVSNGIGGHTTIASNYLDINQWYHIKLELNDSLNTFNFYSNGILLGNFNYTANSTLNTDELNFFTRNDGSNLGYYHYIDAIGLSNDVNYSIGKNMVPYYTTNTSIKEVDKFEFGLIDIQTLRDIDSDEFSNWTEIQEGGRDYVNIANDPNDSRDRTIKIENQTPNSDNAGIERLFNETSGIVNVSWSVNGSNFGVSSEFTFQMYSYDLTLQADIYLRNNFLRSNSPEVWYTVLNDFSENDYLEFNYYCNYNDNLSLLRFYINGTLFDVYTIKIIDNTKDGLGKISFINEASIENCELYLDYVGIYINDTSLSVDIGFIENRFNFPLYSILWFDKTNLFEVSFTCENASIHLTDYPYFFSLEYPLLITPFNNFTGNLEIFNMYGLREGIYDFLEIPIMFVSFYNEIYGFEYIKISGLLMIQLENIYYPTYIFNNIDGNNSYFYVQNNRLYYTLDITQDDIYENITIFFDINNVITVNKSYSFKSLYNGIGNSYAFLNYTDNTIELFSSFTRLSSVNYLLPQDKLVNILGFMASDLNNSGYTGFTSIGYFFGVIFRYIENIEFTITTILLINLMIPLILIMIPTLSISAKIGKIFIIPLFMFMLVISFIGQLIPIWLLLITEVSLITSFFIDKEGES